MGNLWDKTKSVHRGAFWHQLNSIHSSSDKTRKNSWIEQPRRQRIQTSTSITSHLLRSRSTDELHTRPSHLIKSTRQVGAVRPLLIVIIYSFWSLCTKIGATCVSRRICSSTCQPYHLRKWPPPYPLVIPLSWIHKYILYKIRVIHRYRFFKTCDHGRRATPHHIQSRIKYKTIINKIPILKIINDK